MRLLAGAGAERDRAQTRLTRAGRGRAGRDAPRHGQVVVPRLRSRGARNLIGKKLQLKNFLAMKLAAWLRCYS